MVRNMFDYYAHPFVRQYIATAMWSTTASEESEFEFLDQSHTEDDVAEETWLAAKVDCDKFIKDNKEDIENEDPTDIAHNFWLTRNGHGAGFWDGGYEEEKGKRLTKSADTFGETWLYAGDDGKLYF
jgi:hypothetical protein